MSKPDFVQACQDLLEQTKPLLEFASGHRQTAISLGFAPEAADEMAATLYCSMIEYLFRQAPDRQQQPRPGSFLDQLAQALKQRS